MSIIVEFAMCFGSGQNWEVSNKKTQTCDEMPSSTPAVCIPAAKTLARSGLLNELIGNQGGKVEARCADSSVAVLQDSLR